MGEIVNLNKFRKAQSKQRETATADENRVRFGQSKETKADLRRTIEKAKADLDGKQVD
ncbi:MAG TPA: DUF4169 family protein [Stellaceae bacterium]|nr:DUF4169 family protein [Stellaceae bacterium]